MIYYNEHDKFAASWLLELMQDDLIPYGIVDQRDIQDVTPNDLRGFTQCHFFAGIGVWPLAARLAGWSDDRPLWSGSCPCQPFSAAGKGGGFADERHLWPFWHYLIERAKPFDIPVIGEQVADALDWLDLIQTDLEGSGYAFGAIDTCAAGWNAPFIGQRLYWLAASNEFGSKKSIFNNIDSGTSTKCGQTGVVRGARDISGLAASTSPRSFSSTYSRIYSEQSGARSRYGEFERSRQSGDGISLDTLDYWRNAEWLLCRDPNGARFRPVEPGTFPLVDAGTIRNRLDEVRGAGNALNIAQAQGFIEAVMQIL